MVNDDFKLQIKKDQAQFGKICFILSLSNISQIELDLKLIKMCGKSSFPLH